MSIPGFKFKCYKSFANEYAEIQELGKINIFIGRNNSGKSSCLDIIENLTSPAVLAKNSFKKGGLDICITHELTDDDVKRVFPENTYGGGIPTQNHYIFGKRYIGKEMQFSVNTKHMAYNDHYEFEYQYIPNELSFPNKYNTYWENFSGQPVNYWSSFMFRRIDAERNIVPEIESKNENVDSHGVGASNLIRKILNHSKYDENLVQGELLNSLNEIVYPDSKFNEIKIQQIEFDNELMWEIFLQEGDKRYALSKMGSGLKTILLVLINLYLIPHTKEYKYKKIVYAFEELENNLHPALQRRLFEFLYKYSVNKDVVFFITTHSHVAINTYCDRDDVQVYHVEKIAGISKLHKIDNYMSKSNLLSDLDVRASDLLQSNGIIWVEGPSDRIYIKRWLEIFGEGEFEEGRDYQFLYYGGKLLSHYTVEQECTDLINILLTNRNAAIVIDSDKRCSRSKINETKRRVKKEFEEKNSFCWITNGKEIENYLSKESIEKAFGKKISNQCEKFELFPNYINSVCKNFKKVEFAHTVVPYINKENAKQMLDLEKQVLTLYKEIKKWNMK